MKVFKNVCGKHGVQVHFKGSQTIKNLLVANEQRFHHQKSGVTYRYRCGRVYCNYKYTVEFQKHLEKGSRNTLRAPVLFMNIVKPQVIQQSLITSV